MIDRTTKVLLALIALGLWANAAVSTIRPAFAQSDYSSELYSIMSDLGRIHRGSCSNDKIC